MYSGSEGICLVLFSLMLLIFDDIFKYSGDALVVGIDTWLEMVACPFDVPSNVKMCILLKGFDRYNEIRKLNYLESYLIKSLPGMLVFVDLPFIMLLFSCIVPQVTEFD